MKPGGLCEIALDAGYSTAVIDVADLIVETGFRIADFQERIARSLDILFAKGDVEFVHAESAGAFAYFAEIAQRVKKGKKIPKVSCAVNFPGEGLCPGAIWFLEHSGQFGENSVPALLDLRADSSYRNGVMKNIYEVRDNLNFVVSVACDSGQGAAASPWAVSRNPKTVKKALECGFKTGGDGMFGLKGARFIADVDGKRVSLLNYRNSAFLLLKGLPHSEGHKYSLPLLKEMVNKGTFYGMKLTDIKTLPEENLPFVQLVDHSEYIVDPKNKRAEFVMPILLDVFGNQSRSGRN